MRQVYRRTRVLLVPSQWEEGWGRAVTESHFAAIPVLASDVGGLAESVGRGGVLMPPSAPVQQWVEALRELYAPDRHSLVSSLASRQADDYWWREQSVPAALLDCALTGPARQRD